MLWYFGCHYSCVSGSSEGTTCVYVLAKSQTLAAAALNTETQGSQDLICSLEKLFPQDWQAYCFLMRQQKLANFSRRELNVYLFMLNEAVFLVPSRERW